MSKSFFYGSQPGISSKSIKFIASHYKLCSVLYSLTDKEFKTLRQIVMKPKPGLIALYEKQNPMICSILSTMEDKQYVDFKIFISQNSRKSISKALQTLIIIDYENLPPPPPSNRICTPKLPYNRRLVSYASDALRKYNISQGYPEFSVPC
jgi:hypothetical protein